MTPDFAVYLYRDARRERPGTQPGYPAPERTSQPDPSPLFPQYGPGSGTGRLITSVAVPSTPLGEATTPARGGGRPWFVVAIFMAGPVTFG